MIRNSREQAKGAVDVGSVLTALSGQVLTMTLKKGARIPAGGPGLSEVPRPPCSSSLHCQ